MDEPFVDDRAKLVVSTNSHGLHMSLLDRPPMPARRTTRTVYWNVGLAAVIVLVKRLHRLIANAATVVLWMWYRRGVAESLVYNFLEIPPRFDHHQVAIRSQSTTIKDKHSSVL